MLAGDPNDTVQGLWAGPVARSFDRRDGEKRKADLRRIMRQVKTPEVLQGRIYPEENPRVMRDPTPPAFEAENRKHHIVPEVFYYGYVEMAEPTDWSLCWILTFFQRARFVAFVQPEGQGAITDAAAPS